VDLYIGGSEHATGHLLYSRFWNKILFDLGIVNQQEPFKKLINQGMIQGVSAFLFRTNIFLWGKGFNDENQPERPLVYLTTNQYQQALGNTPEYKANLNQLATQIFPQNIKDQIENGEIKVRSSLQRLHADIQHVNSSDQLDILSFLNDPRLLFNQEKAGLKGGVFLKENWEIINPEKDTFTVHREVEKMSKSKFNVINPDDIIERYGADTLRLYEMFLGPLEQFKPWNTNGIDGVSKFLKKLWRLYHDKEGNFSVNDAEPTKAELKTLHKTIKKAEEDVDRYSFNTSVSNFMICVNELTAISCNNRAILSDLAIVISPYAPHISEELWQLLGHTESIATVPYPQWNAEFLKEDDFEYPVAFNGKMRVKLSFPVGTPVPEIQAAVLADKSVQKWLEGKAPKKVIVVPNKIVNIVV
jgi:leucyl-tRNA synthetase